MGQIGDAVYGVVVRAGLGWVVRDWQRRVERGEASVDCETEDRIYDGSVDGDGETQLSNPLLV